MFVPVLLFLISLAGMAFAVLIHGLVPSDLMLMSSLCFVAAAALVLWAALFPKKSYIVVDGSNVMHWRGGNPSITTVRQVVQQLIAQGYAPMIWFDANVGYKIGDRYLGPVPLARALGVPVRQVFVVSKGTPADPLLLAAAEELQARVVSNDQFRDWAEDYPMIKGKGFLILGSMRNGKVALNLE
ncbi:hypothetical protein I5535_09885 [Rhodobacteraceae bacterium F11138]|nr:hypothetical protein [Rhodobacteraceae bacterium F11138]